MLTCKHITTTRAFIIYLDQCHVLLIDTAKNKILWFYFFQIINFSPFNTTEKCKYTNFSPINWFSLVYWYTMVYLLNHIWKMTFYSSHIYCEVNVVANTLLTWLAFSNFGMTWFSSISGSFYFVFRTMFSLLASASQIYMHLSIKIYLTFFFFFEG